MGLPVLSISPPARCTPLHACMELTLVQRDAWPYTTRVTGAVDSEFLTPGSGTPAPLSLNTHSPSYPKTFVTAQSRRASFRPSTSATLSHSFSILLHFASLSFHHSTRSTPSMNSPVSPAMCDALCLRIHPLARTPRSLHCGGATLSRFRIRVPTLGQWRHLVEMQGRMTDVLGG